MDAVRRESGGESTRARALESGATAWFTATALGVLLLCGAPGIAAADGERNACGCQSDGAGNCSCDKSAKCGCPGQCEPRGCAERRERQLEKEIAAETRRAQELERASQDRTREDAPAPAASKSPAPRLAPRARSLTARQRRDLARLLELYVAGDRERRAMSTDEILRNLGGESRTRVKD